jgi:hypothetical protein
MSAPARDTVVAHEAIVPQAGIGIKRDVRNKESRGDRRLHSSHRAAQQVVGIEGLAGVPRLAGRHHRGKQGEGAHAQLERFLALGDRTIDRQSGVPRHTRDRISHLLAIHDE